MAGRRNDTVLLIAAALGAVSGMRSMAAPALLSLEMAEGDLKPHGSKLAKLLTSDRAAALLTLLASGEMLADKSSMIGKRTSALPLIGRAALGSFAAATYAASRGRQIAAPAVLGGAAAVGAAFAVFHIRSLLAEKLDLPDRLLGLIEDAVVVAASRRLGSVMEG